MATSHSTSSHIEAKIIPLALLTQQSRWWSSKVLLVEKSHRSKTKLSGKEFQRYIFVDEAIHSFLLLLSFFPTNKITYYFQKLLLHCQGTQIQAMSYTPNTTIVDTVLQPLGTYIISNAKIVSCNMQYRIVNHPFQWVLTTSTSMEPAMESLLSHSLAVPTFTPFSELHQHKSTDTNLNILAIVLDTSNPCPVNGMSVTSTVQDLVLITAEKIHILLSCWNDFITSEAAPIIKAAPNFPIIAGLRLRAQEFRGLSLATKGLANLILNPPYPDAKLLKTCHFIVRAHLSLPLEEQDYYYMSCPSCFHNTTANSGMQFTCRNCDKQDLPKPRARCTITISDDLTQMDIVAFGEVDAKLIGISAVDLLHMDTEETPINLSTINNALANNTYELHIRKKPSSSQHASPFYYNLND